MKVGSNWIRVNFQNYVMSRRYWEDFEVLSNGVEAGVATNLSMDHGIKESHRFVV